MTSILTIPCVFISGGFATTAGYLALTPEPAAYAVGCFVCAAILTFFIGVVAQLSSEAPDAKYSQWYRGGAL